MKGPGVLWPDGVTGPSVAMAHRTPTTARAMATGTPGACWPLATRRRSRVHRRTWAFQRLAWMTVGGCSRRRGSCRLPWAGSRYAQAPATSALRAWVFPALGLAPWGAARPRQTRKGSSPRLSAGRWGSQHGCGRPLQPPSCRPRGLAHRARPAGCRPPGATATRARALGVLVRDAAGVRWVR